VTQGSDGILNIDGFNWSALKLSEADRAGLPSSILEARVKAEHDTFAQYHQEIREAVEGHRGRVWATIGDCTIACGFPNIDEAVAAAATIQRRLADFNRYHNRLSSPLIVRIGVARGDLPNIPYKKRGEHSAPELDEVGHLQKDCPPGRIRISRAVFEALRFGPRDFRPGLASDLKSKSTGSLVWSQRSWTPQDEKYVRILSPRQQRSFPIISTSASDVHAKPSDLDFSSIRDVLQEAFVVVGETRTELPHESPVSHLAATSDAVGVIEIFGALQSSSKMLAGIDEWVDSEDLATQRNLVIIGSPVVNIYAYAVNTVTSAGFVQEPDGLLRIRVPDQQGTRLFPKAVEHSSFDRHYGLVVLARNPINPKCHMLWIAGISGMATQAASRFVRDLVLNPTQVLKASLGNPVHKPNIAVVAPHWQSGWQADDYQGKWRVNEYEIVWLGVQ